MQEDSNSDIWMSDYQIAEWMCPYGCVEVMDDVSSWFHRNEVIEMKWLKWSGLKWSGEIDIPSKSSSYIFHNLALSSLLVEIDNKWQKEVY